jgi:hypothetical protein
MLAIKFEKKMAGETNYLSDTFVKSLLGGSVAEALFDVVSPATLAADTGFLNTCYAASAVISRAISSMGYTAPTDGTAVTPTQYFINLATLGEFVVICYNRPGKRLPLPDGWQYATWMIARKEILSGEIELDLPTNVIDAHGGISATSDTDSPTVFARKDYTLI